MDIQIKSSRAILATDGAVKKLVELKSEETEEDIFASVAPVASEQPAKAKLKAKREKKEEEKKKKKEIHKEKRKKKPKAAKVSVDDIFGGDDEDIFK